MKFAALLCVYNISKNGSFACYWAAQLSFCIWPNCWTPLYNMKVHKILSGSCVLYYLMICNSSSITRNCITLPVHDEWPVALEPHKYVTKVPNSVWKKANQAGKPSEVASGYLWQQLLFVSYQVHSVNIAKVQSTVCTFLYQKR